MVVLGNGCIPPNHQVDPRRAARHSFRMSGRQLPPPTATGKALSGSRCPLPGMIAIFNGAQSAPCYDMPAASEAAIPSRYGVGSSPNAAVILLLSKR